MRQNILIYSDSGVHPFTLKHTKISLEKLFPSRVKFINAEQVLNGAWKLDTKMFVMPGGADLYYVEKLNGAANQIIKDFVMQGGVYLGICAGAYYASREIEFDKDGPLEVTGERELDFFPGKSIGPALSFYDYGSANGATAAKLSLNLNVFNYPTVKFYHHGGGYFQDAETTQNVTIIASYIINHNVKLPAVISSDYGKGKAILSGVHFEIIPEIVDQELLEAFPEYKQLLGELNINQSFEFMKELFKDLLLNSNEL